MLRKTKLGVAGFMGIILPSTGPGLEGDESWGKGRRWKRVAGPALTPFPAWERRGEVHCCPGSGAPGPLGKGRPRRVHRDPQAPRSAGLGQVQGMNSQRGKGGSRGSPCSGEG